MFLLIITIQHVPLGPVPCPFHGRSFSAASSSVTPEAMAQVRPWRLEANAACLHNMLGRLECLWFSDGFPIFTRASPGHLHHYRGWLFGALPHIWRHGSWSRSDWSIVAGSAPYFDYPIRNKRCTEPASQGRGQNSQPLQTDSGTRIHLNTQRRAISWVHWHPNDFAWLDPSCPYHPQMMPQLL